LVDTPDEADDRGKRILAKQPVCLFAINSGVLPTPLDDVANHVSEPFRDLSARRCACTALKVSASALLDRVPELVGDHVDRGAPVNPKLPTRLIPVAQVDRVDRIMGVVAQVHEVRSIGPRVLEAAHDHSCGGSCAIHPVTT
jgi:hypothetical protein